MAQLSFGSILREERERKGYDVSSVARRLRIRPDILRAIEEADFLRMPPRGYARNMVNAYARFLGLNPTEITRLYLDEAYANEVKKARSNSIGNGFDMSGAPSDRRFARRESGEIRREHEPGRMLFVDSNTSRYNTSFTDPERPHSEQRTHRTNRSAVPNTHYTNFYAGPKKISLLQSRLPLVIAGAVILILIIVFLVFIFGPKGDTDNTEKIPVNGGAQANQTEVVEKDEELKNVPVAPTMVEFTYEVAPGQEAWVEIYLNNADTADEAGVVTGPITKGYDVTGVLRLDTPRPDAVSVYLDGEKIELTDEDGDGTYSVTIDFPAILVQWHADNSLNQAEDTTDKTPPIE